MAALTKVVEISDLDHQPCRQALVFTAQIFSATNQIHHAITCVLVRCMILLLFYYSSALNHSVDYYFHH